MILQSGLIGLETFVLVPAFLPESSVLNAILSVMPGLLVKVYLRCESTTVLDIGFTKQGEDLLILLVGGDKRTQKRDIEKALRLAREL